MVRWLLTELMRVCMGQQHEGVLEYGDTAFGLKKDVEVWLYVSVLPVGMLSAFPSSIAEHPSPVWRRLDPAYSRSSTAWHGGSEDSFPLFRLCPGAGSTRT